MLFGGVWSIMRAMRCRHCDYLLFNLTHNECPECGRAFRVHDYRFDPGAVSFHCPHCDQAYFGNDDQGLPYPRRFRCVSCEHDLTLADLRVVPERDGARGWIGSAWDNRQRHGFVSAWWSTLTQTLLRPRSFYREHVGRSNVEAYLYAVVASYVGMVPAIFYQALFMYALMSGTLFPQFAAPAPGAMPAWFLAVIYGMVALIGPLVAPVLAGGFYALTTHTALFVMVPHRQPLAVTYRTSLYSFGGYVLYALPVCGGYVGWIWQLVIYINGIKEVHRTNGWIAAAAVLWPVFALMCLYLVVLILLFAPNAL